MWNELFVVSGKINTIPSVSLSGHSIWRQSRYILAVLVLSCLGIRYLNYWVLVFGHHPWIAWWPWDWTGLINASPIILSSFFSLIFLFVLCGGLSWLRVRFLLHAESWDWFELKIVFTFKIQIQRQWGTSVSASVTSLIDWLIDWLKYTISYIVSYTVYIASSGTTERLLNVCAHKFTVSFSVVQCYC